MSDQPGTYRKLNRKEFARIAENMAYRKKAAPGTEDRPHLPLDMGLFLTGRCNLRCRHCFEWNENGFMAKDPSCADNDIPADKIAECLEYTKPAKTRLYLWGGEPLVYRHFHELCMMIKEDPRHTTVCTNGLLIEDHLDDLLEISDDLVLLISLDGLKECNDSIRGQGTFDRVVSNIQMLMRLSAEGRFRGEVSVCCVMSDEMAGSLYEFCEFMEGLGINTLYLSFPWYISPECACEMDEEFERRFGDIIKIDDYAAVSWHDFTFHISDEHSGELKREIRRIANRRWKIRIRFQPAVDAAGIDDFISGESRPAQGRTRCLAPFNRLDILQDGNVSPCKLFRELSAGNVNTESLRDIWEGDRMRELRSRLSCGLMPVCSKCVLLYLNGE